MPVKPSGVAKKSASTKAPVRSAAEPPRSVRTHTVSLLDRSLNARQAKAAIRKAISEISDRELAQVRGIHIFLVM